MLPPSVDAGRDNLYANSVFLLIEEGWIYFSNLNCSQTSSIVNVYSCDNYTLTCPLKPSIKKLLNHYFLQRCYLKQYHVGNFSEHDSNSAIHALLSCYSSAVKSQFIRSDLLTNAENTSNFLKHFIDSRSENKLLPFPWSSRYIYRDMIDRPHVLQTFELLTEVELVYLRSHEYAR